MSLPTILIGFGVVCEVWSPACDPSVTFFKNLQGCLWRNIKSLQVTIIRASLGWMMPESSHPLNWNLDPMYSINRETIRILNHSHTSFPQIGMIHTMYLQPLGRRIPRTAIRRYAGKTKTAAAEKICVASIFVGVGQERERERQRDLFVKPLLIYL